MKKGMTEGQYCNSKYLWLITKVRSMLILMMRLITAVKTPYLPEGQTNHCCEEDRICQHSQQSWEGVFCG